MSTNKSVTYICPHCQMRYTLGVNGTVDGCDECKSIIRNALDGSIVTEPLPRCWCFELVGDNPDCPQHGGQ